MIPDEAVEAAAHDLAVQAWGEWEYVPNELRKAFLRDARICLEAAAPHLMEQAWDEGEEYGEDRATYEPVVNPYRKAAQ